MDVVAVASPSCILKMYFFPRLLIHLVLLFANVSLLCLARLSHSSFNTQPLERKNAVGVCGKPSVRDRETWRRLFHFWHESIEQHLADFAFCKRSQQTDSRFDYCTAPFKLSCNKLHNTWFLLQIVFRINKYYV